MTPKEKADELVGKCFDTFINDEDEHYVGTAWKLSKQCALIAVNEVLQNVNPYRSTIGRGYLTDKEFYEEVKKEIEKHN